MRFDIQVTIHHLASNGDSINGYMSQVPITDHELADVEETVDQFQTEFGNGNLTSVTLFTRERRAGLLPNYSANNLSGVEITIPSAILQGSVISLQIVSYPDPS